jgi:glycosyltransferase involved in cell wall biosynthesis
MTPHTGIASYTRNLVSALIELGALEMELFYGFSWSRTVREGGVPGVNVAKEAVKRILPNPYPLKRAVQQFGFNFGARRFKPDVYHEPNFIPFKFPGPVVISVHDLSPLRHPDTHPPARVRVMKESLPLAIDMAAAIIVDSEFIKKELIDTFAVPSSKVTAIHLGVSSEYRPRSPADTQERLAAYGLTHGEYMLAVGTLEPRKNLVEGIAAHSGLPATVRKRVPLVIAGMKGWLTSELEARIGDAERRGDVRWLGYVPPGDLPLLYSGARLFIYPSLYEGFGLPVLEAMASGVPVITSDQSSLPEVAGNAAIMVDPRNRGAIREAMQQIIDGQLEAKRYVELGLAQAARFTWQRCAEKTLETYRTALRRR